VGQADVLETRSDLKHWKYKNLRLDRVLYREHEGAQDGLYCSISQDHGMDQWIDFKLVEQAAPALDRGEKVVGEFPIINLNRATGTMLSNEISKRFGGAGLPEDTIRYTFRGTAGQSFGAFLAKGVRLELEGDANDYFGKGLSGGHLVIYPDRNSMEGYVAEHNQIIGNVSFFGATSGKAFIRGMAGERFCVRNSGAHVVVEGVGDHGCEYMTGGVAVILGATGRNFAAGMSGGVAYVLDVNGDFNKKYNDDLVDLDPLDADDQALLLAMVTEHQEETKSPVAARLLADWDATLAQFIKVMPKDYKAVLAKRKVAAANKETVNG
jgi:glutamate synthase (NADPH/NADH) large chain